MENNFSSKKNALDQNKTTSEPCNIADFASLQETPVIPDDIFLGLPEILKRGCEYFENKFQKDLFLTGALGVISGCFNNVIGKYHIGEFHANLYTFISAPAANGKGALNYARALARPYHKYLAELNPPLDGEQKNKKILFIPGNTSASALISHLQANEGSGIFFESEADTLANTFKQDWGNFSDLLRKAFHHEEVSLSRRGNNEHIEINKPKLSIVLSGTPNQITRLIPSVEDGLFSRFIFYHFENEPKWENVTPNSSKLSANKFFNELAKTLLIAIMHVDKFKEVKFSLTDKQFGYLNAKQDQIQQDAVGEFGNNIASITKRQGLIWFKMAMILSVLRSFQYLNNKNNNLICNDKDFEIAGTLTNIYTRHSFFLYKKLENKSEQNHTDKQIAKAIELLPDKEFSRQEFMDQQDKLGLKARAMDNLLRRLRLQDLIKVSKYGYFIKIG